MSSKVLDPISDFSQHPFLLTDDTTRTCSSTPLPVYHQTQPHEPHCHKQQTGTEVALSSTCLKASPDPSPLCLCVPLLWW
jgi:hypothetical protein